MPGDVGHQRHIDARIGNRLAKRHLVAGANQKSADGIDPNDKPLGP